MKKSVLVLPLFLCLTACNENNDNSNVSNSTNSITNVSSNKGYSIVKFDLNYEIDDDTYLDLIVFAGQNLKEPEEPNRRDYVFEGWYLDEECSEKYKDFGKELTKDLTLYASWSSYEDLKDNEKIDKFIEKIQKYSGKVGKTTVEAEGIERYYTPADQAFPTYQKIEYNRYSDITTIDYYNDENVKYAEKQFFYEDDYFYGVYSDIENNGSNNEVSKAPFSEEKIDKTLNIDFMSLFGSLFTTLSSQIKNGSSYDEIDYDFTFNYTHMDPKQVNYTFSINYYTYLENIDFGAVEEIYMMEFGFTFINGMISKSKIIQQYMLGIQGEVQYAIEDNIEATFELVDQYKTFDGERFNPSEFE